MVEYYAIMKNSEEALYICIQGTTFNIKAQWAVYLVCDPFVEAKWGIWKNIYIYYTYIDTFF